MGGEGGKLRQIIIFFCLCVSLGCMYSRIRSENRKHIFAAHEYLKNLEPEAEDGGGAAEGVEAATERSIGPFTPKSFAKLLVDRVINAYDEEAQEAQRHKPCNPLLEYTKQKKRAFCFSVGGEKTTDAPVAGGQSSAADASASAAAAAPAAAAAAETERLGAPQERKKAKKKRRMQQEGLSGLSESLGEDVIQKKTTKDKWKKTNVYNGKTETDKDIQEAPVAANGLRLPIRSSGTSSSSSSNSSSNSNSSNSSSSSLASKEDTDKKDTAETAPVGVSASSEDCSSPKEGKINSFEKTKALAEDTAAPAAAAAAAAATDNADTAAAAAHTPQRRRSVRISESTPSSKRVLFNLKKNKVVAFSRHAPSVAVGPASPPGKGRSVDSASEAGQLKEATSAAQVPPRGILRAAKEPGPPTSEENAPMPSIQKLQRLPWWKGSTAELMAALRRALAEQLSSRGDAGGTKGLQTKAETGAG
ncbi:Nucleolar protein,Nop52 domain containing protein, putative [Eimeria praecox]|uniref:Nucleolar protein,Nop52 domain containing protein, putative n=1 Tax=Eimeria praecox TaxID=51316 RepID=U6GYN9_9EIME|nr:Nucleolar protein,Nop52 domain containing protein, putative [Eimeria praecox]